MRQFRVLVCGLGSVGERHVRNLRLLGQREVAALRTRNLPLRTIAGSLPQFSNLAQAMKEFMPEVAIITNPTSLHVETALAAAAAGCHVLVEKPVGHRLEGLAELAGALKKHGRHGMVAYMLRFHPLLQKVKAWLEEGAEGTLGRPLYAHFSWGEHVPDWHPWEDYADSYAVRRDLGGGPALTYSHDLDLCQWLFGDPREAAGWPNQAAPLAGDAEHGYDLLLRYDNGLTAHVHADYFTTPPQRTWELVGARGRVEFDYYGGTLALHRGAVGKRPAATPAPPRAPEIFHVPEKFDRNDMFVAELRYFLDCLERGVPPQPDLATGARVVQLALRARESRLGPLPVAEFSSP